MALPSILVPVSVPMGSTLPPAVSHAPPTLRPPPLAPSANLNSWESHSHRATSRLAVRNRTVKRATARANALPGGPNRGANVTLDYPEHLVMNALSV
jgi:hypothetical protein